MTGMNEKILSEMHPIGHKIHTNLGKLCIDAEKNGHKPMPSSGTLNTHRCVSAKP